jgi:hypothetical protein
MRGSGGTEFANTLSGKTFFPEGTQSLKYFHFRKSLVGVLLAVSLACSARDGRDEGSFSVPRQRGSVKRPVPTQPGGKSWRIAFLGDRRGEVGPCGCGRQPAGGMAALAGRLVEITKEGPVLFLDLGNYSGGPTPTDRMNSSDIVLDLYAEIARVSGATVVATPGPNDPEPTLSRLNQKVVVTRTDPALPGVRLATIRAGSLPVRICAVSTTGLDAMFEQNACLTHIEKAFAENPGQLRLAVVSGGTGVGGEVMARRIERETSADLVFWTENGLGYVEGQQGRALAASGDKSSLCEVEIRTTGLLVSRSILEVARYSNPGIEKHVRAMDGIEKSK